MACGAFAASDSESYEPKNGEDDSDNPEKVDREAYAEEQKYE
jgi:hypothetical protein